MQHTQGTYHRVRERSRLFDVVERRLNDRGGTVIDRRSTTNEVGGVYGEKCVSTSCSLPSEKETCDRPSPSTM